jgi:hypothetical protein
MPIRAPLRYINSPVHELTDSAALLTCSSFRGAIQEIFQDTSSNAPGTCRFIQIADGLQVHQKLRRSAQCLSKTLLSIGHLSELNENFSNHL